MRAILVDDEPIMLRRFERLCRTRKEIEIVGCFEGAPDALFYAEMHPVDVAFLDIDMPQMDGIKLAEILRKMREDIMIVFVTAYDHYIGESNRIGGDYYLLKPFTKETISIMIEKLDYLSKRQKSQIYIQTFGRFVVTKNGLPIPLKGRGKEILAYIVSKCGKEAGNEEIYHAIWEDRPYSNANMTVYYNALRRLKKILQNAAIDDILISTSRGQMVNTELFDCDYYEWKQGKLSLQDTFDGEFLSEYSWAEEILAQMINGGVEE